MKRPLAYITAPWKGGAVENAEQAAQYCRAVYEAGYAPICPTLFLPLFLHDPVPQEHKDGIDIGRDLLRRSRVLVVCGHIVTEEMKNDISLDELPVLLQAIRSGAPLGQSVPKDTDSDGKEDTEE